MVNPTIPFHLNSLNDPIKTLWLTYLVKKAKSNYV